MKYSYLLFDCDRTLLDFNSAMKAAITKLLLKYGVPEVTDEMVSFYDAWNNSLWDQLEAGLITKEELVYARFPVVCSRYGITYPGKGKMESDYILFLSEGHEPMPDALDVVKKLSEQYKIFIVSNGFIEVQERRVTESGLRQYLCGSFISEEIGFSKPDPRFFEESLKQIGDFDKSKYLIIGDSMTADIQGGVSFGIDTCLVSKKKPEGYDFEPTYVVGELKELLEGGIL